MDMGIARRLGALAATFLLGPALHAAEMVLPSEVATTHWKTGYMNEFAEEVKKKTGGQLVVKVFPAGQLYNDQDAMAALGTGAVHMVWPVAVRLETIDPRTGIINLPFVLSDELMTNQCFNRELTSLMSSYVEPRKLQVLGFLRTSDLLFVFKDRDVKKMEDLKGAKVRVTGGKVFLDTMRSLNTSPVSMAASEMSTALSQGAIDGIFTSPAGWAEMIGMTAKYAWYVPGMSVATYAVIVDKAWLDGLPPAQRKAVTDSVGDIAQRQWQEAIEADKKLVQKMTTQGAVFRTADAAEIKRWRERAAPGNKLFTDKHPDVAQKLAAIEGKCGVRK
ncbi:MAG TPA: TRAP transporter substrate-binding protein DctP [Usitatibacter sp.]|nr:TRAP transporter substrate-binding protein DctP [Usitatibacter sp.]